MLDMSLLFETKATVIETEAKTWHIFSSTLSGPNGFLPGPHILYGLECCQLNKADLQSLDFSSNRLFMKLFGTGSIDVVQECRNYFGIELPSCVIKKRRDKFLSRFNSVDNLLCRCRC